MERSGNVRRSNFLEYVCRTLSFSMKSHPDHKHFHPFFLFYSILFYSILFYSILFYSILFYSILFYSILFYSILFYSVLNFSFLSYPILSYPLQLTSIQFNSIRSNPIQFSLTLLYVINYLIISKTTHLPAPRLEEFEAAALLTLPRVRAFFSLLSISLLFRSKGGTETIRRRWTWEK